MTTGSRRSSPASTLPAATGLSIDRRRATRDEAHRAARRARHRGGRLAVCRRRASCATRPCPTPALREALGDRAELHAEAACFPVDLLDPQPGERILEACSGRGNKTLQLASAIGDRGTDRRARQRRAQNRARAGAAGCRRRRDRSSLRTGDATALDGSETFDAMLVDAPCSGIGIIGRQPEARWRKSPDDGARLAPLQRALLDAAARALAPRRPARLRGVFDRCARRRGGHRAVSRPRFPISIARRIARALRAVRDRRRRRARAAGHRRARRVLHRGPAPAVNAIARFEQLCARVVEGTFARIFPSALEPAQVGRKLTAAQAATPTDTYLVRVHPVDYARFAGDRTFLEARWSAMLRENAPGARIAARDPARGSGDRGRFGRRSRRWSTSAPPRCSLVRPDGEAIALFDGMRIGRADDNDVAIADGRVSRHHARIVADGDGFAIEDSQSSNGTFVDGAQVRARALHPGASIVVGETVLESPWLIRATRPWRSGRPRPLRAAGPRPARGPAAARRSTPRSRPGSNWSSTTGRRSTTRRFGRRILVGRAPSADVRIDDPRVSRLHARIEMRDDGVYVEDLGSRNGTLVDGAPVAG